MLQPGVRSILSLVQVMFAQNSAVQSCVILMQTLTATWQKMSTHPCLPQEISF